MRGVQVASCLCGGIQSVVRAWERSGLAGWRRGAGTNEGVEWLPRAQGQPKAQLNGHKSCLVVSTSRARNLRVAKAELSPNNNK